MTHIPSFNNRRAEYPWMQHVCYEPAPTLTPSKPEKLPRLLRAVFWMAVFLFCLAYALGVI